MLEFVVLLCPEARGKHLLPVLRPHAGRTRPPSLQVASGDLSYLGPQWRRDIAFAGNNVPMQVRLLCAVWL